jgi:hypothetical protein
MSLMVAFSQFFKDETTINNLVVVEGEPPPSPWKLNKSQKRLKIFLVFPSWI